MLTIEELAALPLLAKPPREGGARIATPISWRPARAASSPAATSARPGDALLPPWVKGAWSSRSSTSFCSTQTAQPPMANPRPLAWRSGGALAWRLLLPAALGILILVAAMLRAWVSDDAYLTFRTIENFVNGWGLRWNTLERVQTYTHPLWMLLMSGARAVTGEYFYSSIALSLVLTAGALAVLATRVTRAPDRTSLALALLFVSRAFLDFATSGLENSLAWLLLALFQWVLLTGEAPAPATDRSSSVALFTLSLLGALLAVTRLDLLLLVAPALVWRFFMPPMRRGIGPAVLGAVPLVLWEAFSIIYYGFPVANTVYAKLATGLPQTGMIRHGLEYLLDSLRSDPVTLPVIALGVLTSFLGRSAPRRAQGAGLVLYLLYVVWVGGDFMSGRFLTAPLFVATALLALAVPDGAVVRATACAIAVLFGCWPGTSPFRFKPSSPDPLMDRYGVADERLSHFDDAWIGNAPRTGPWPNPVSYVQAQQIKINWTYQNWISNLQFAGIVAPEEFSPSLASSGVADSPYHRVIVRGAVGVLGYHLGPDTHILDFLGLGDPLLARLPAVRQDPMLRILNPDLPSLDYRPGHYVRRIPLGYYETLVVGTNRIRDPRLAEYYNHLARVTRGPLFDRRRLVDIWRFNTGQYDHLLRMPALDDAFLLHPPGAQG